MGTWLKRFGPTLLICLLAATSAGAQSTAAIGMGAEADSPPATPAPRRRGRQFRCRTQFRWTRPTSSGSCRRSTQTPAG